MRLSCYYTGRTGACGYYKNKIGTSVRLSPIPLSPLRTCVDGLGATSSTVTSVGLRGSLSEWNASEPEIQLV